MCIECCGITLVIPIKITIKRNLLNMLRYCISANKMLAKLSTLDSQSNPELFFQLPTLPTSGYEICHSLSESPQKSLLDKFKQLFPAEYNQLLDLHIQADDGALSQLMAVATLIIGAYPVEKLLNE